MMETKPAAAFVVRQAELLLELVVVALDASAHLGGVDELLDGDVRGQIGQPMTANTWCRNVSVP